MRIVFRPEAQTEALQARDWYEARTPGLGLEFAHAVEAAVARIARNPEGFPGTGVADCRRILLRKFPYSLIYRAAEDILLIVAVFHHRRDLLAAAVRG